MTEFDVEIFNPDPPRLVPNTSKIVSSLQNAILPPLDLLVRESIQNSLDAAVDEEPERDIRVEFKRGDFDRDRFADLLGLECASRLKEYLSRKKGVPSRYMAIRDSNCQGLTGNPLDKDSNIYKLVYGFLDGKGDSAAEGTEGGSYGVGKTVFLHFGIGFVIYYSRIADGTSRMSIFYCRNQNGTPIFEKAFMPFQLAWWGRQSQPGKPAVNPVEDGAFIRSVLGLFGIEPYSARETGTTIIIPFFDDSKSVIPYDLSSPDRQGKLGFSPWENDVDAYLRFSVLKWYSPRYRADLKNRADDAGIDFRGYRWGRFLRCRFSDGKTISPENLSVPEVKIFGLIRDMYDMAIGTLPLASNFQRIAVEGKSHPKANVVYASNTLGWFVITKINYVEGEFANTLPVLNALVPEQNISDRRGFVLYCRRPGMIMTYDDSWDRVLAKAKKGPNEFFVSLFVVNSDNKVYSDTEKRSLSCPLDQLFRETENSAHYGWPTSARSHDVPLIQHVVSKLRDEVASRFGDEGTKVDTQNPAEGISRGLGVVLAAGRDGSGGTQLFPEGNGGIGSQSKTGSDSGDEGTTAGGKGKVKGKRRKTSEVIFGESSFKEVDGKTVISVPVSVVWSTAESAITLCVAVETDDYVKAIDWNKADGDYPIVDLAMKMKLPAEASCQIDQSNASVTISPTNANVSSSEGVLSYAVLTTAMSTIVMRSDS